MADVQHDAPPPAALRGRPRSSYARSHQHPDELPPQTEKQFMAQVVALARLRGWLTYHTYDSRKSTPGMPDLILVRGGRAGQSGRILFVEVKSERGRVTVEQRQWLDALATVSGAESFVWRPSQWDELDAILA